MIQPLLHQAQDAIKRGDGLAARALLEELARTASDPDMPWLLLARACRMTGDAAGEEAALHKLLTRDPRDLAALLQLGNLKAESGDDRAATSWFQAALGAAAGSSLPPGLNAALHRAQAFVIVAREKFEAHMRQSIGGEASAPPPRVGEAIDLMLGHKQIFPQRPTSFYFPGLPQRQFYERHEFPWLAEMEAMVPTLQRELRAIIAEDLEFAPYVQTPTDRPAPANPLRDDPSWGALYLWKFGELLRENANRTPATMQALSLAPIPEIKRRSPMALYSLLKPGTHIQPHNGLLNTRLICHIPLIAPEGCALRVGNETREWRAGETLIFDDSVEHEAWNYGSETRIVLLFEIWRPEISADERAALTALFAAINDYAGVPEDAG